MRPALVWVGGWAMPLDAWAPQLKRLYPEFEHRFLNAHDLLEPVSWSVLPLPPEATVIAWSLGSLLALEALAAGMLRARTVAICPVADFTARFRPRVLDRMRAALPLRRGQVLEDFRRLVWPEMPAELASAWQSRAATLTEAQLDAGLLALRDRRVDVSRLRTAPLMLVATRDDPVSPAWPEPDARLTLLEHGGHTPFLQDPENFAALLKKAAFPPFSAVS